MVKLKDIRVKNKKISSPASLFQTYVLYAIVFYFYFSLALYGRQQVTPTWPAGQQTVSPDKGVGQLLGLEPLDAALWVEGVFSVSGEKRANRRAIKPDWVCNIPRKPTAICYTTQVKYKGCDKE